MNTILPAVSPQPVMNYVGFFMRFVATCIDTLLLLAIIVPLGWSAFRSAFAPGHPMTMPGGGVIGFLINWVLMPALVVAFWRFRGGTPGKMAIGAVIVDANTGLAPTTVQLIIRYLGYFLSTVVFGLGFLWVIWDARKQAWHDKLARTVVIKR